MTINKIQTYLEAARLHLVHGSITHKLGAEIEQISFIYMYDSPRGIRSIEVVYDFTDFYNHVFDAVSFGTLDALNWEEKF